MFLRVPKADSGVCAWHCVPEEDTAARALCDGARVPLSLLLTSVMICWTQVVPDLQNVHTKTSSSLDTKELISSFVASSCPINSSKKEKRAQGDRAQTKRSKLVA